MHDPPGDMGSFAWGLLALIGLLAAPGLWAVVRGRDSRTAYARLGLRRGKVLVINHFEPYRDLLLETLRRAGYKPYASHPRSAPADLQAGTYQIVVSGLVQPFLTGDELLATVKASSPRTQVILLTGEPTSALAAEAIRHGAFAVLDKRSMDDLTQCVHRAFVQAVSQQH